MARLDLTLKIGICACVLHALPSLAAQSPIETAHEAMRVKEFERAKSILENSRDSDPAATYLLGCLYFAELVANSSEDAAKGEWQRAAQKNYGPAEFALAALSVTTNHEQAVQLLKSAAKHGDARAQALAKHDQLPMQLSTLELLGDSVDHGILLRHMVARSRDVELAAIANATTANAPDAFGRTAVFIAAENGDADALKTLLEAGGRASVQDHAGLTPLMIAAAAGHAEIVPLLVNANAAVNAGDHEQNTALHFAARSGDASTVQLLLHAGAQVSARNAKGWTAIDYALQANKAGVAQILSQAGGVPSTSTKSQRPNSLDLIRERGKFAKERDLYKNRTDLEVAVARADLVSVQTLLAADVKAGLASNHSLLALAIRNRSLNVLEALLAYGLKPNEPLSTEQSPLRLAVQEDCEQCVALLLQAKANPEPRDSEEPVLILAVKRERTQIVDHLLHFGANPNVSNNAGTTALMLAARANQVDLATKLLAAGASIDAQDKSGQTALALAIAANALDTSTQLITAHADTNLAAKDGTTALQIAARNGNARAVNLLVDHGALVSKQNAYGDSPLLLAAGRGHADVVQILVASGAELDAQNQAGDTALHAAARRGALDVAQSLLAAGASRKLRNKDRATAADVAKAMSDPKLAKIFQS